MIWGDVHKMLRLNRESSKSEAARLKIIRTHFREGFVVPPFLDMDLAVLPHSIAWMGRKSVGGANADRFYGLLRNVKASLYGFLRNTKAWHSRVGARPHRMAKKQKTQR